MKALNELIQFVRFLGALNVDFFHGTRREIFNRLYGVFDIFVSVLLFAFLEVLIIWRLKDEGYRMSSPTATTVVGGTQGLTSSIYLILNIYRISATIDHLRSILAKNIDSYEGYEKIELRHAFITRTLYNMLTLTCVLVFGAVGMQPIAYLIFNYPEPAQWQLSMPLHNIWRLDTFFGFYASVVMEAIACRLHVQYMVASASFHLGICMYIREMTQQLKIEISKINEAMLQRPNFADINRKLIGQIKFHDDILVSANLAQHAMSFLLFSQLVVCATVIALGLFGLQSNDMISTDTVVSIYEVFCVVGITFIYCNLSNTATSELLQVTDTFYDANWFMLPVKYQTILILPIQRAQREFYFNGLRMVNCTLKTFLVVIKTALSYFLIIRELVY